MLVDMTHANEQRPAATGNAADNVSDAPTGPATSAAARPTTVTADGTTATNGQFNSKARSQHLLGQGNQPTSSTVDDYRHGGGCGGHRTGARILRELGIGGPFGDHYDSGGDFAGRSRQAP